ncbi:HAD-IA family hydrolase [Herbaspirillum robiniae]|uniref:HAD-IA family hydrolase n=1 Tax=Herbaspirillum robiniae TaxID=2014887 RepID=A0ABX2M0A2_9BURK|nr:HAD-IA family hydrolase [Herbaspirillum robiniae]NUU04132.1 HAD-IA family hydrolase [Herbaspirillum robiniae]
MLLQNTQFKCSGLLFDMDGTLLNSEAATYRAYSWWASKHGLDTETVLKAGQGRRTADTVKSFAPTSVDIETDILEIMRREREDVDGVIEMPGAIALLKSLPPNRWAIVTSADRQLALARLTAAGIPIPEVLITAENVQKGKPSPEGYLLAARTLKLDPTECIVFEDAPAGLVAGIEAGAMVIAISSSLMASRLGNFSYLDDYRAMSVNVNSDDMTLLIG